jgi:hypothetical protein
MHNQLQPATGEYEHFKGLTPVQKSALWETWDPSKKAAILNADLAPNGIMPATVAATFIKLSIKSQMALPDLLFVAMRANTARVPTAQMNARVLQPAVVGSALAASLQAKPTFAGPELTTVESIGEVAIDDTALEDNVELEALRQTVLDVASERVGFDLEDAAFNGDDSSVTDALYAQQDGYRVRITSHTGSASSNTLDKTRTKQAWKLIPQQYRKRKADYRFYTADDATIDFGDSYQNRIGDAADVALRKGEELTYMGIPVVGVPAYPNDLGGNNDETELMCTRPKNLVIGIQREVRMETLRDPRARQTVFIFTIRRAHQIVNNDEASLVTAVAISAT